jgi:putative transposase
MERLEAYKFELRPDGPQRRLMRRLAGSCRYVYNRALALQQRRFDHGESGFGYAQLCQQLTAWRSEALWLGAAHSQILQQALKDLQCAYRNFLEGRAALPRLKKALSGVRMRERAEPADAGSIRLHRLRLRGKRRRRRRG